MSGFQSHFVGGRGAAVHHCFDVHRHHVFLREKGPDHGRISGQSNAIHQHLIGQLCARMPAYIDGTVEVRHQVVASLTGNVDIQYLTCNTS